MIKINVIWKKEYGLWRQIWIQILVWSFINPVILSKVFNLPDLYIFTCIDNNEVV